MAFNKKPLTFKKTETRKIKVLINGLTGTGKSTAAKLYCDKHDLNPVVFDIDDTNYAFPGRILDIDFDKSGNVLTTMLVNAIQQIADSEYDTIIVDGIDTLNDLLTPPGDGQLVYKKRADNFKKVLSCLKKSNKNLIFIGQKAMVMLDDDKEYSKPVQQLNNMVNFTFRCYIDDKGQFGSECTKWRGEKEELY